MFLVDGLAPAAMSPTKFLILYLLCSLISLALITKQILYSPRISWWSIHSFYGQIWNMRSFVGMILVILCDFNWIPCWEYVLEAYCFIFQIICKLNHILLCYSSLLNIWHRSGLTFSAINPSGCSYTFNWYLRQRAKIPWATVTATIIAITFNSRIGLVLSVGRWQAILVYNFNFGAKCNILQLLFDANRNNSNIILAQSLMQGIFTIVIRGTMVFTCFSTRSRMTLNRAEFFRHLSLCLFWLIWQIPDINLMNPLIRFHLFWLNRGGSRFLSTDLDNKIFIHQI